MSRSAQGAEHADVVAAHRAESQGAPELDNLRLETLIVDSFLLEHSADAQKAAAEFISLRLHT